MPELSRFYGIVIKLIFLDDEQHHKPHIHVKYGEYKASVGFDGDILAGSLPSRQYRMVSAWVAIHERELYEAWELAVTGKDFGRIDPLL